jgi:hypothetical protein
MIDHDTLGLAWIGAVAALAGGLVSGAYQHARDWWSRPQLKLNFDEQVDRFEASWAGTTPFDGVLIRASMSNTGRTAAHNCRVYLAELTIQHSSGSTKTTFMGSRQLPWAGWDFKSRSIQNGIVFYIDLARVSKASSGWQFTFKDKRLKDNGLQNYRGTYRFHLTAVADNAEPSYLSVDIDYDGDWHNLRAWSPTE